MPMQKDHQFNETNYCSRIVKYDSKRGHSRRTNTIAYMSARYSEKLLSPELSYVTILQLLERGGRCLSRLAAIIPNPVEVRRHIRSRSINSQNLARGAHRRQTSHDDTRHLRASGDPRPGRDAFFIILISVPLCKYPCQPANVAKVFASSLLPAPRPFSHYPKGEIIGH